MQGPWLALWGHTPLALALLLLLHPGCLLLGDLGWCRQGRCCSLLQGKLLRGEEMCTHRMLHKLVTTVEGLSICHDTGDSHQIHCSTRAYSNQEAATADLWGAPVTPEARSCLCNISLGM